MIYVLGGFAVLGGFLMLVYLFVNADPVRLARGLKATGIVIAIFAVATLAVSGRLAACGGIECEDQPPAPARMRGRRLFQLVQKFLDVGGARLGRKPVLVIAHHAPHAGLSHTEVSWKTAPPRGRPGSALVNRLIPIPSSNA